MRVIAVTIDHQVNVHVPETGQYGHAFRGKDLRARRNREPAYLAHSLDSLVFDNDYAVANRRTTESID